MPTRTELKEKMLSVFSEKIDQWIASQENQTDGFEYERSYVEALQKIGTEVFQLSLGNIPKSKNQKKTPNQSREINCK
jgi:hypothetical protein